MSLFQDKLIAITSVASDIDLVTVKKIVSQDGLLSLADIDKDSLSAVLAEIAYHQHQQTQQPFTSLSLFSLFNKDSTFTTVLDIRDDEAVQS